MERRTVAAHFVAFVCFLNRKTSKPATPEEAGRFARKNWEAFLPYADEGLGNLVTKISGRDARKLRTAPTHHPSKTIKTGKRQFMTACYQPRPVCN